jgi:hypothetical protein
MYAGWNRAVVAVAAMLSGRSNEFDSRRFIEDCNADIQRRTEA